MLKENQIHKYWEQRVAKHGIQTIGFRNKPLYFQSKIFRQRIEFIFPHCPCSLRTLDFGCGTGNFSTYFESYLGVDINKSLLNFAKTEYPKKNFILLGQPAPLEEEIFIFKPELFFSVTVLQHNPDDLVKKIFKSMAQIGQDMMFSIYENSHAISRKHIKGRLPEDYLAFLSESFNVLTSCSFSHYTHDERHSLTIAKVKPL